MTAKEKRQTMDSCPKQEVDVESCDPCGATACADGEECETCE